MAAGVDGCELNQVFSALEKCDSSMYARCRWLHDQLRGQAWLVRTYKRGKMKP
jgi:hypothetical protein